LQEIANKAMERKTGARGLRSIIEETMLDVMFEVPSQENVKLVRITKETVDGIHDLSRATRIDTT
ncbi:hypothetical protein K8353_41470, partial [Burkholderia contaminans]|nr:hypothetical protein [Burkholderia contaminans]